MNIQDAIERLSRYPLDAPVCMVLWLTDDVIKQAAERNMQISDELAAQILESLDDHHDANYGITWEHINAELDAVSTDLVNHHQKSTIYWTFPKAYFQLL